MLRIKCGVWCRVCESYLAHPGTALGDRNDRRRLILFVDDPQVEVVVLDQLDVGDRRGVVVTPASGRQDRNMSYRWQRHAGVEDRIDPCCHAGRVSYRSTQDRIG